ncbi:MAG: glycosyltransferase [Chloroflexi bacterium]|nr:glycosyltransferase [Chloroflexota bacterium]MCC6897192.1 glycosyltransferase [Anaerolineae bacterium]
MLETTSTTSIAGLTVLWVGNPRYTQPLNDTEDKKWKYLTALGVNMIILGFATGLKPRDFTQHARFILLPELPSSILRYLEMFTLAPLIMLWLVIRRDVRIIVATSPFEGALAAWVKNLARLFGRKVALVVESHGDFEVGVLEQRKVAFMSAYRWAMGKAARYGLRHADVLRGVSKSTREQLGRWSSGKPIHQFMAWTDASAFRDRQRDIPVAAARDLVYAGVLIPRKEVHTLLKAFAAIANEVPDAHLWLVGKPENTAYTAELHSQTEALGLQSRVTFVGKVSQAELGGYMARGRALVLPSLSEGLPRVVIEAMFSGLAVIASRVSGIPEVIEDGVTGYLMTPKDTAGLTDTLRQMYANPDIEAMTTRARATAEQVFSEGAFLEGYRKLLTAALDTVSGKRP